MQHAAVFRQHDRLERVNAVSGSRVGQLAEQNRGQAPTLVLSGDGKGHLGAAFARPRLQRVTDNTLGRTDRGQQSERMDVIDVRLVVRGALQVIAQREEA